MTDLELGLRQRYEIRRQLAPYVGITWTRLISETASLAEAAGEDTGTTSLVAGLRVWL